MICWGYVDAYFLTTSKYTEPGAKNPIKIKAMVQMIYTFGRIVNRLTNDQVLDYCLINNDNNCILKYLPC